MKIEQGKKYKCVDSRSTWFTIEVIYSSPEDRVLIDNDGARVVPGYTQFEEVKEKHMIKVIGLDGKEVQQREQEKPIQIISIVKDSAVFNSLAEPKNLEHIILLAKRNRLNKYDLMQSDSGAIFWGHWNSGHKQVPELKPIELTHSIGCQTEPRTYNTAFDSEHIKDLHEIHHIIDKNKMGASCDKDVIKLVCRDQRFEHLYLGHWNDGILPTFE